MPHVALQGEDGRRLRPNILIGSVDGLAERDWPGQALRIGDVVELGLESPARRLDRRRAGLASRSRSPAQLPLP